MIYRGPREHILDDDGLILKSDITEEISLNGKPIVGKYIGEMISESYVRHFYQMIEQAIQTKSALCSYEIQDRVFMTELKRISDHRIKAIERDVTEMCLHDVLKLF